ncbi:Peptidyl-prolyl cis-trans isomerase [Methylacidimicrobium sp. AP8]|uniref:FKBP-type peptidyl-prolyl cis-trans isomerase n=1 Tax=Methylacidimicrobium sp. AP8 TaxID=2730359 RepID=UPI0018C1738C|nr:FKBP-type peptidyl-prolyl cis-trans isomerase [Methylacidimicrobium sp. AP8]CAB4242969.1 Peptidyl-prolyl cis-trans isomerase [Methylacidimicrobium sp. AP8]
MRRLVFLLALLVVFLAAGSVRAQDQPMSASEDGESGTEEKVVTTPSGLKYVDIVVGRGNPVAPGKRVTVDYVGKLEDGKVFDSSQSHGKPFTFVMGQRGVIAGWTEGIATMREGGKRKLIIPPQLGYGVDGAGDVIPPNAVLLFDIEVLKVE